MKLYYVSRNRFKYREFVYLLQDTDIELIEVNVDITELQSEDMSEIVRDKAIKAFTLVGHPVLVDHTGLAIEELHGLPGGLTQLIWEKLGNDLFSRTFTSMSDGRATAITHLAYCDGRQIHLFSGAIRGMIVSPPRGDSPFQWDPVFQPDGYTETFSQMGERKNSISMRKIAVGEFIAFLKERGLA